MANDGFGTLSAAIMERGSNRVRAVLDETNPEASSVDVDMTFTPVRHAKPGESKWLATQVPTSPQRGSFTPAPADNDVESTELPTASTTPEADAQHHAGKNGFDHRLAGNPSHPDAPSLDESSGRQHYGSLLGDLDKHEGASPVTELPPAQDTLPPAPTLQAATNDTRTPRQNPVSGKHTETTERRAGGGTSLTITQPKDGDMSQVTISIEGAPPIDPNPQKGGQRPSSITYERRTADTADAETVDKDEKPVWIETKNYSGPDRRHQQVSPEVERRKTVPPRIKVGVRLEQERYLRLKLASVQTGRTQQDLVTSALDHYFDDLGFDRFVRIAMGFGVSSDGSELDS